MANDPTLDILTMFDDATKWEIVPNVPMMVPHQRLNPDGSVKYQVGTQRLSAIVATMEALETEDGVLPKIQVGHTVKGGPEPEILGYIRNRRVDNWGPKAKPGVIGDYWYHKDKFAKASGLPVRSAEFYPPENRISASALLSRDPELDMGMVLCERDAQCEFYSLEKDTTPMSTPAVTAPVFTPELIAAAVEFYQKSQKPVAPAVVTPVTARETEVETMVRLAKEESAVELKRQADTIVRLEKLVEAEQYARRSSVAENTVKQLQLEGYVIKNVPNLVVKLSKLSDESLKTELSEIRENYSRAPLEQPTIRLTDTPDASKQCSREDYDKAVSYATANNVGFDVALAKVRGK